MISRRMIAVTLSLFPVLSCAANPFLDASNDQPISAKFRGTEWSEDIGEKDIPLAATVVTTRIAKMPWGAIFKIEFTDLKSRAEKERELRSDYFIVTDQRIVLLNEEDNEAAVKKIAALEKPLPVPRRMLILPLDAPSTTAKSDLPSPLKSPTSTSRG